MYLTKPGNQLKILVNQTSLFEVHIFLKFTLVISNQTHIVYPDTYIFVKMYNVIILNLLAFFMQNLLPEIMSPLASGSDMAWTFFLTQSPDTML